MAGQEAQLRAGGAAPLQARPPCPQVLQPSPDPHTLLPLFTARPRQAYALVSAFRRGWRSLRRLWARVRWISRDSLGVPTWRAWGAHRNNLHTNPRTLPRRGSTVKTDLLQRG